MIHWLGAGLSSGPGIRALAASGKPFTLWNRTPEKARAAMPPNAPSGAQVRRYAPEDFKKALAAGDIVVSMLPANMHPEVAELCLLKKAHLVTTSYVSDAMKALHAKAKAAGLSFVNECGLDPGLDHLLAHLLVAEYRAAKEYDARNVLSFRSYCGGVPKVGGDFLYKFSWSPLGVLRALKNRATYLSGGKKKTVSHPWEDLSTFPLNGEAFEVYPNRDSMGYLEEYGFDSDWHVDTFVRGTMRLSGWSKAWKWIFDLIPTATDADLEKLSADLWTKHAYKPGEQDRVVLYVGLEAKRDGKTVWSRSYALDECGAGSETAMARLVSLPATFAVAAIAGGTAPGVSGAPKKVEEAMLWLGELKKLGITLKKA